VRTLQYTDIITTTTAAAASVHLLMPDLQRQPSNTIQEKLLRSRAAEITD